MEFQQVPAASELAETNQEEQVSLEARLEMERAALVALIAALPDGLLLINAHSKVTFVNHAAARLLATEVYDVLNKPLENGMAEFLLRVHEVDKLKQALARVHLTEAFEQEVTLLGLDGDDDHYIRLTWFPVQYSQEGSDEMGRGLLLHDTTGEKTADQLKNEFVAVVSHELRTPLSAMQGFSELLLTQNASPERQHLWLEMINRESVRLASLIDDMLSLSRLESGRVDLRLERLELGSVVRQCVEILRVGSSKHSFRIEMDENFPAIRADRDRLVQIFNNIIGNAIKYSTKGGTITIAAHINSDDSNYVQVDVSDQGVGIPYEELPKVFEKFYRVKAVHTKEIKGTGLGLAITKSLIELQSGRIWVTSEAGQGSTFSFTIPIHTMPQREIKAFKEILLKTLLVPTRDTTEAELYLDYLQRTLPSSQMDEVLRDVLYEIGDRWHTGKIGVGDEHLATGIIRDFLSRNRPTSSISNNLKVVIGSVAGEEHIVGMTMVSHAFARAGWGVTNLGANVPIGAFITTLEQVKPDLLLISISRSQRLIEVKRVVHEVHEAFPNLLVGVGGRLLNELPDLANRLGVNFHGTTPDDTVRLATYMVHEHNENNQSLANTLPPNTDC